MPSPRRELSWVEVDGYLEAFETAWVRDGGADPADFLPPRDHPLYASVLRELACVDLEMAHRHGQQRRVEDYHARFPELRDPVGVTALAEQEYSIRLDLGESVHPTEYHARFGIDLSPVLAYLPNPSREVPRPNWREQAAALYVNHQRQAGDTPTFNVGSIEHADLIHQLERDDPELTHVLAQAMPRPEPGTEFVGFRLLSELGRGTFGRVFLAEQKSLAGRLVALKVGERLFDESQTLAQLQHTHIVPIYSLHTAGPVQALCMPFLGSTTLVDVIRQVRHHGGGSSSSNAVWSTLHQRAAPTQTSAEPVPSVALPPVPPAHNSPLDALRLMSHVRACLWIAARLADGLAHAHDRGIVHRDLKPANILLSDDGTPRLLDFNLSQDVRLRGELPSVLGGTLPYMAPEHFEAFRGGTRPVDARSDIYSLGLILWELLTGEPPFPVIAGTLLEQFPRMLTDRQIGPPRLPRSQPGLTPAVEAILRRCLDPEPEGRYPSAWQLQEDIQCHLDDQPLKHTPEPSWRERSQKFVRRHPRLTWASLAVALSVLLIGLATFAVFQGRHAQRVEAANTLRGFRDEARDAGLLLSLPFPDAIERAEGESLARRALERYGMPDSSSWERRALVTALPTAEQEQLRGEVGELLLLLSRATRLRAASQDDLAESLKLNERAGDLVGDEHRRAVLLQRAWLHHLRGRKTEAEELWQQASAMEIRTARDLYTAAVESCSQGEVREATRLLDESIRRDPSSAAVWAARGGCLAFIGRHDQAAAAFTTCIALRSDFWRASLWRGQAYLESKDFARALVDLDEVLRQRPGFVPALVFRALARLGKKDYRGADADLSEAIDRDAGNTRLYFMRSRVRQQAGQAKEARHDFEQGLQHEPLDELSCIARGVARLPNDPAGALADFDKALRLEPNSRDAAQNKAHVLSDYLGRNAEAIAVLDAVVKRYPDYTEARIGRGVLHARLKDRMAAHEDAAESLRRDTRALIRYQAGCIYALTSRQEADDRDEAFRLLNRAVRDGFAAEQMENDADLAALRNRAEFRRLVELARTLRDGGRP